MCAIKNGQLSESPAIITPADLAHQLSVSLSFVIVLRYQHGVYNARYPEKKGEYDAQYKCADTPGC